MADPLDILDSDEAFTAINGHPSPQADDADALGRMVTRISRRIDKLCGPVVWRTVTDRLSGSGPTLMLPEWPVASVTTLTEYTPGNATGQLLTGEDEDTFAAYGYLLDPDTGIVTRRSNGSTSWFAIGDRNLVAVYVAGRFATTADVDGEWKDGAAEILSILWPRRAGRWARSASPDDEFPEGGPSVDQLVRSVFEGELLPPAVA